MNEIDLISINFKPSQLRLLNICLGILMFGVALDMSIRDFKYVLKSWKSVWVGLSSQLIILPVFTIFLISLFKPADSVALGMLLVSVCPGGNVSNFMVHSAKGNTALSITLTSISSLTSLFLTPLGFYFWSNFILLGNEQLNTLSVSATQTVTTIFYILLIPLLLGMAFRKFFSDLTQKIKKPIRLVSILIFFGFVIGGILTNQENITKHLHKIFVLVVVHNGMALLLSNLYCKMMRLPQADQRAITIETGIQNSGLALLIIFNFFDGLGGMALVAASWGIWHLITGGILATVWSRTPMKDEILISQ